MSEQTIRRALGKLQDDPDNEAAWTELQDAATDPNASGMGQDALLDLLEAARREHASRREDEAVAKLLELETLIASGTKREVELQAELARHLNEVLDDVKRALPALQRLAELRPDDEKVKKTIADIQDEKKRWPELLKELMDSADRMESNPSAQAGILFTAAQTAFRYGLEGSKKEVASTRQVIIERLEEARELASDRKETALLLERLYRAEGQWEDVARVLEKIALEATDRETRLAAYIRLARVAARQLKNEARAAAAYERVLDLVPGHEEAMGYLVDHFSKQQQWESVIAAYEDALRARLRPGKEMEIYFQIAMLNWRMRDRPELAEPYFEKIRRAEPAHPAMLTFFREYLPPKNEQARLVQILTDAQRAVGEGNERQSIVTELAKLSEETQGAGKAIEHWRQILRSDPSNQEARDQLKRLYYRTEAWPALIDLVRQGMDRLPANDAARVPFLKELMQLHRDKTRQDASLVPILNQLVQLDPTDIDAVREQVRIFEALNRPRDLIAAQTRLAELEPNVAQKAELWRAVARQWLEKFSNIQNAVDAYEKLLELLPDDEEAAAKLRELYGKRRAFKPLFDLLAKMRARASGTDKRDLTLEMAKLAAERLDKGADAITLYWELLADDPKQAQVLDALEKQAERDKDFAALSRVVSHRVDQADTDDAKIKLLEKLGTIYDTRLRDPQKSIETWRRVLSLRPGYPKAVRILREELLALGDYDSLVEVYSEQQDWEGLADALSFAADRAEDVAARVALSWRVADVYVEKIKRPDRAAKSYERVLAAEGASPDDRVKAATALVPILEGESSWARLPAVYDVLLAGTEDKDEQVRILGRLRELAAGPLADRGRAFDYARRAYALRSSDELRAELERAARAAGAFEEYVSALRERLAAIRKKKSESAQEERRRLQSEIARVLSADLGRIDDAVAELRTVVDADANDENAVLALDRLLREAKRADDLRALYALRLERAESIDAQVSLLVEWAQLEEDVFGDSARALESYRKALALAPDHRVALRAIARMELASGNAAAAAKVLEHDRDLSVGTERAEREVELAKLYLRSLERPAGALAAAVRTLEIARHDPGAIEVLERLEEMPEHAEAAARHLEQEYDAMGAPDKQARALERLLTTAKDGASRRELHARLASVHREKRADPAKAFEALLRAVAEFPEDLEPWDRLAELGTATGDLRKVADAYAAALEKTLSPEVSRELCERASILLEDKLGDPDGAIPYLQRILETDPTDTHAFTRLKQILTARERWDDLQKMYDRAIETTADASRRVDLLSEVALVFEDILDDPARAASAYERVLTIDADNEMATRALDKLYARTSRFADLSALLSRQLDRADDATRTALEGRLARLHLDKLDDPKEALRHAASILEREVDHTDARHIARTVMERPETRVRAAEVLERVYLARDEARELDEVTAIRLAESGDKIDREERIDLLRRLARLRDERLANDEGALDALSQLVPLDPKDEEARKKLLEVGRRAGAHARVAEVLGKAADRAEDVEIRGRILLDEAHVFEDLLADDKNAELVYRRILLLEGGSHEVVAPALKSLERIYEQRGQHKELAEILGREVEHSEDPLEKGTLLGRLGALREGPLDDKAGAIEAWKQRLAGDEADLAALEALDRLYSATSEHRALVAILEARIRLADQGGARRELLRRNAEVLDQRLGDVPGAIEAYRTLLEDFGPDRTVLAALSVLYEKAGAHRDLADALEKQLELASEANDRVSLLAMVGKLRIAHLDEMSSGLEAYRDALTLDPAHAVTRKELERLLEVPSARAEAAALLRPLYETESAGDKLLAVLEIQADSTDDPIERLEILATAVQVAEERLKDPKHAFSLASRGLEEAADGDGVRAWLERVERLAAATGNQADLVALLRKIEPEIVDGEAKLDVVLRIASLAREKLADKAVARTYYVRALDLRGDDVRALEALETLYEEESDWPALLDILKRRAGVEVDKEKKTALLFKQAKLSEDKLEDPRGAIEALEEIVEGDDKPPFKALVALERLYGQVGRWEDVVALLERQLGTAPDAPPSGGGSYRSDVELHHALGVVIKQHLSDVDRALEEFRTTLTLDPTYAPTIGELEAMLQDEALRARAAEILEPVYLQRVDWKKVMQTLEVRLLDADDPAERRSFLVRIAGMHEDEAHDLAAALSTYARLLAEDPSSEETWQELERVAKSGSLQKDLLAIYERELGKVTADDAQTAKLAFRAGEIAEKLGQSDDALRLYRRAHAVDPAGRNTFDAIDRLLSPLGRADERIALYREALDHRFEAPERVSLLRTIAELQRDVRNDNDAAIEAFRELLEIDDRDAAALDALEALFTKTEHFRDLADLLERRADAEGEPEKAATYRLRLGKVLDERLGDESGAIDRYEQIVQVLPTHRGAIDALEAMLKRVELKPRIAEILRPLYEGADDWRRLITLSEERLAMASDVGEKTSILREAARLWEERGNDKGEAFAAIRRAWALDPEDGGLRAESDRLGEALGDWDGLVAAYEEASRTVDDVARPDLLRGLAELHDKKRDDPRRALDTLERLHELDRDDVTILDRLDRLAALLGDWAALDRILAKKADAQADPSEQAQTFRRLGALRREMLDDTSRAIEAYEHALEVEAESAPTLDALIALYEERDDAKKLVDLYQRRVDLAESDDELKYNLLMRRADRSEKGLSDAREAIASLQTALSVRANDVAAARSLERLYEAEKMWSELLEAMRLRAANVADAAERIALRKRIAELQARELQDPAAALEIYRQVLDEAPTDEGAIAAVRALGAQDDELRATAADVLEPVLRAAGRHQDLVAVLEMRLGSQQDAFDRGKTLNAIARVHEEGRKDVVAARDALLRALDETPDDKELRAELERLAGLEPDDAGFRAYADALDKRAEAALDPELQRELLTTLSRVAEEKLKNDARAAKALSKATEQSGDLPELLEGLDRLYARLGQPTELADVLTRRIEVANDPTSRSDLRTRLSTVQIKDFGAKREGLATLRTALEEVPDHKGSREALEGLLDDPQLFDEVAEALEPVYRAQNDHGKLASLFERRIERAVPRDRTRLRLDLARVLEERANDPKAAQRQVERALKDEPTEYEPFIELERLLPITGEWSHASEVLSGILKSSTELSRDVARDMWLKLAGRRHDHIRDDRAAEEAYGEALKHDPENVEVLKTIEGLQRVAGRERELVSTLRRRAELEGNLDEKRILLREAHTLSSTVLSELELAEAILRELLKDDEANAWALEELTKARAAAKDYPEVFTLLTRRAELGTNAGEQSQLRHEAARVAKNELKHSEQAIELYRELLDASDGGVGDEAAARELRELYQQAGRHHDLADLLTRLIDNANTPEARSKLRLELAALQNDQLDNPDDAIETLRAILDEEPGNTDAVLRLSDLYEKLGKHEDLAELLAAQIERAVSVNDVAAELTVRVRLGELYATQLKDPTRAVETYEAVLARDPKHVGALSSLVKIHEQRGELGKSADALSRLVDESSGVEGAELALKLAKARADLKEDPARERALRRALDLADAAKAEDLAARARKELRAHYSRTSSWADLASILVVEADLESDPQVKAAHLKEAAEIHLQKREAPGEAASLLERATALVPDDRPLLLLLCDALSASGRGKDAADVLRKVIESFGGKRSKELAIYHHRLAQALDAQGNREGALEEFDRAFKIDPGNIIVLRDLGKLALDSGNLELAQKTFRALLLQKLDPSSGISKGEVFYFLGEISERQGDRTKALQMFERAVETDPSLAEAKERVAHLKTLSVRPPLGPNTSFPPPPKPSLSPTPATPSVAPVPTSAPKPDDGAEGK